MSDLDMACLRLRIALEGRKMRAPEAPAKERDARAWVAERTRAIREARRLDAIRRGGSCGRG